MSGPIHEIYGICTAKAPLLTIRSGARACWIRKVVGSVPEAPGPPICYPGYPFRVKRSIRRAIIARTVRAMGRTTPIQLRMRPAFAGTPWRSASRAAEIPRAPRIIDPRVE